MSFLNKSDVKNHFSVHHSDRVVMSTDEPQAAAGVVLRDGNLIHPTPPRSLEPVTVVPLRSLSE
jgi:hypothetical protein